jgi:hypothetical protein
MTNRHNPIKNEREGGRNYSRNVDESKIRGKSERNFILGRKTEHNLVRRFPGFALSSF